MRAVSSLRRRRWPLVCAEVRYGLDNADQSAPSFVGSAVAATTPSRFTAPSTAGEGGAPSILGASPPRTDCRWSEISGADQQVRPLPAESAPERPRVESGNRGLNQGTVGEVGESRIELRRCAVAPLRQRAEERPISRCRAELGRRPTPKWRGLSAVAAGRVVQGHEVSCPLCDASTASPTPARHADQTSNIRVAVPPGGVIVTAKVSVVLRNVSCLLHSGP